MTRKKQSEKKENIAENKVRSDEGKDNQSVSAAQENSSGEPDSSTGGSAVPAETAAIEQALAEAKKTETELTEKLAEMQDRYLRLMAEFENYRRRTLREKIELTKSAGEEILKGILPVLDDFERALRMMSGSSDCNAIKEGINLIYNKFVDFMKQNGVKEIESLNCDFNVDLHEAVSKIQVEDESLKGKVVEGLQKGYYLNDKVMRHSKVVVGE